MTTALVLIDIQNDYFPGGKLEVPGSPGVGHQAARLLGLFRDKKWPIIHVQHLSVRPGATFFLPDTPGVEIHESVAPLPGETIIQKYFPNSFRGTFLLEALQQAEAKRVVFAGMMTQMCVDATVRAAFDFGFSCVVAHDACAAAPVTFEGRSVKAEDVQAAFLGALGSVYAQVQSVEEMLATF
ncbi:MAG: cysteine hydrolase [Proteobacteria bacterium]|nr:cysteine hydrolase [Pseudomonadota bacterium]MBU1740974.1 cysteine hydrolase [Pseudomonadota bacterium]